MGKKICAQGRITRKWIIQSSPNSNSFQLLCLSSLSASLTKIQSKVTEKSWRHHFFHRSRACNSKMTGQIWPKFELVWDFMPVLISCKSDEDWIHSNWEKMATPFSPFKVNGNAQGWITPPFFPIICQWELSVAKVTKVLIRSAPKPDAAFPPPKRCYW